MLSGVAFALARRGHNVSIITSRQRYDAPEAALPPSERIDGVEVVRVATSRFGRARLVGRAFDYLTFYLLAATAVTKHARCGDIVVAKTDPPMLGTVLWPIIAMRRAKLVNWLQDIFPEVAAALGVGNRGLGGLTFNALARLRDFSLRHAAANVVLGERMAAHVACLGVSMQRISIITNWADGKNVHAIARADNDLRRDWGLADAFVVGYSGNLGRAHDIATILEAIEISEAKQRTTPSSTDGSDLDQSQRTINWLFIGGGAQFEALKAAVERRGFQSVLFKPYQPQEKLSQSLSVADVHLISLRPALEGLIVPSKFYGIAAAGRPSIFIGAADGEIARIVTAAGIGEVVHEGDSRALASAVLALAENPPLAEQRGRRAREHFELRYDLCQAISAWEKVLHKVASETSVASRLS